MRCDLPVKSAPPLRGPTCRVLRHHKTNEMVNLSWRTLARCISSGSDATGLLLQQQQHTHTHRGSHTFSIWLSLALSLSRAHTQSLTHTLTHTHTHTLCLSRTDTHTHTHTHTHTQSVAWVCISVAHLHNMRSWLCGESDAAPENSWRRDVMQDAPSVKQSSVSVYNVETEFCCFNVLARAVYPHRGVLCDCRDRRSHRLGMPVVCVCQTNSTHSPERKTNFLHEINQSINFTNLHFNKICLNLPGKIVSHNKGRV